MNRPVVALVVGVIAAVIAGLILALLHIGGSSGSSSPATAASQQSASVAQPDSSPPSAPGGTPTDTTTAAPAIPNGKTLGSYQVILPNGNHVPIGPTHPVASQISATGAGDIMFTTFSDVNTLYPIPPYSSIAPFTGVPTYQGCLDDTDKQPSIGAGQGTAFCLYEQGLIVGGVITYIDQASLAPESVTVMITVWSDAS